MGRPDLLPGLTIVHWCAALVGACGIGGAVFWCGYVVGQRSRRQDWYWDGWYAQIRTSLTRRVG